MGDINNNNPDHNNDQYNSGQQTYDNGQQYYGQNTGYNNEQYYNQNGGYNNGQYYSQNVDYNNGQYYNQNGGYNNGQYYGQNVDYNNGQQPGYQNQQYNNYGQNGGQYYNQNGGYNNGQYYNPNAGYNGQYYGPNGGQQYYGQQPFPNAQAAFAPAEPVREPVTNVFYYILMGLTALTLLLTLLTAKDLITTMFSGVDYDTMAGQDFASIYSSLMETYASNASGYTVYSLLNYLLGFAIIALSIVDIVLVYKKGYPIVGLILFTIFFKPGYFLWRAHVVKQKKTIPLLFTIGYVVFYIIYFLWCFSFMLNLAM